MAIVEISLIFIGLMLAIIVAVLLFGKDEVRSILYAPSAIPSVITRSLRGYYRAGRYAGRLEFALVTICFMPSISFGISLLFTDSLILTNQPDWYMSFTVGAIVGALIFSPTLLGRALELNDGPSLVVWLFVPIVGLLVWLKLLISSKEAPTFDPTRHGNPFTAVVKTIFRAALITIAILLSIVILITVFTEFSK